MAERFEPRRAKPGESFEEWDEAGESHTMTADDEGVVQPRSVFEVRMADHHGLPVARKALEESKSEKSPAKGGKE